MPGWGDPWGDPYGSPTEYKGLKEKQIDSTFRSALTQRDGSVVFTGNLPAGSNTLTNSVPGTAADDASTLAQLENLAGSFVAADQELTPYNTSGNYQYTGLQLSQTPISGCYVQVYVTLIKAKVVTDGVRANGDCYFSYDNGASAALLTNLSAGARLYWNGTIAGFDLSASDDIVSLDYMA